MSGRGRPDINLTQIIAGGLATTTAMVGASFLGVVGTVVGTALMSVISTAGAAIYQHYLDRGKDRIVYRMPTVGARARGVESKDADDPGSAFPAHDTQTISVSTVDTAVSTEQLGDLAPSPHARGERTDGEDTEGEPPATDPTERLSVVEATDGSDDADDAEGTDAAGSSEPDASTSGTAVLEVATHRRRPWPRWYVLAGVAAGIFVVVMGGVTAFELFTGKPIASSLGGAQGAGTTWSRAFGGGSGSKPISPEAPMPAPGGPDDTSSAEPTDRSTNDGGDRSTSSSRPTSDPTTDRPTTHRPTTEPTDGATDEPTGEPTDHPTTDPSGGEDDDEGPDSGAKPGGDSTAGGG